MTELEALDVLMVLRAGLPNAYLKLTEADTAAMVALWAEMFCEYPAAMVAAAAKTYIWNDQTGRFPSPGTIRAEIDKIQEVIGHCTYGSTIQEYMGESSKRFPAPVRTFINESAANRHIELYGRPFLSQAEKLARYKAMILEEGGKIDAEPLRRLS